MGYFIGGICTGILGIIIIETGLLFYIMSTEDNEDDEYNEDDGYNEEDIYNDW